MRLSLGTRRSARADADAELESVFEERVASLVRQGMSADEARAEALRRLGAPFDAARDALGESAEWRERRLRTRRTVDELVQDGRYTLRGLGRRPVFTLAVILCLALGLGANTTMFGIVDTLLLRPPSGVRDPGSLVWINSASQAPAFLGGFTGYHGVAYLDYLDFSHSPSLTGAAAYSTSMASFGHGTSMRQISTLRITSTFMPLLGVRPALGRFFTTDDDGAGSPPVAVVGYAFWQGQFAGAQDVIGRDIRVGTGHYTVVGVAPPDFNSVERTRVDVYLTLWGNERYSSVMSTNRRGGWLTVLGRIRPNVRREVLAEELTAAYHHARSGDTLRNKFTIAVASPMSMVALRSAERVQNATVSLWLAGVAAIVLMLTCANVASLLFTRAARRRREIAVRLTLGIGRGRLVRMLMTESLVLAAFGGLAGLAIAQWGGRVVRAAVMSDTSLPGSVLDPRVLAVTLLATITTGLVCGLAPALYAVRRDLVSALKSGERGPYSGGGALSVMLVGQVALTVLLLVGTGLFVRSLRNLNTLDLGFDVRPLLRARVDPGALGDDTIQNDQFFHELLRRSLALPGVQRAALATAGPFGNAAVKPLSVPGQPSDSVWHIISAVTPEFFATLGMSLIKGRLFTDADRKGSELVTVVNEDMARHYWPAGDAIGKCIKVGGDTMPCTTVVGIVRTASQGNFTRQSVQYERPQQAYYVPYDQVDLDTRASPFGSVLYVRSTGDDGERLVPVIRRTMEALAPELPYPDVTAFTTALAPQIRPWRLGLVMFGIFGAIALALAVIGLYGVLAFRVSLRTQEIGIRVALGAQRGDVHWLVIRQGLVLGTIGVAIGLAIAVAIAPSFSVLVFHASPRDPIVLATTAGILLAVVALASYLPARRAVRIDPLVALQEL